MLSCARGRLRTVPIVLSSPKSSLARDELTMQPLRSGAEALVHLARRSGCVCQALGLLPARPPLSLERVLSSGILPKGCRVPRRELVLRYWIFADFPVVHVAGVDSEISGGCLRRPRIHRSIGWNCRDPIQRRKVNDRLAFDGHATCTVAERRLDRLQTAADWLAANCVFCRRVERAARSRIEYLDHCVLPPHLLSSPRSWSTT